MRLFFPFCFFILIASPLISQTDDINKLLEQEAGGAEKRDFINATFKTTRLVNGHSIENTAGGVLDFRIKHHFGKINTGPYEFFGLDNATMRLSLEYGINNIWMVGLGRSTFEKTFDGFSKIKILRQSKGKKNIPLSISYLSSIELKTLKAPTTLNKNYFSSKLFFCHQIILARKFSEILSLQISPTLVHHNLVPEKSDPNDFFSTGLGGRVKLNKRTSLNIEYYPQLTRYQSIDTKNAFSIGFDIETGGHVFQVFATNSGTITERQFITATTSNWLKGDVVLGFCISRVFTLIDPRKPW